MKIYSGDLVHSWGKVGFWTIPLNVAYVSLYAQKEITEKVEIKLFKDPEVMIEAIKTSPPDVVALAYYVWNINLNHRIMEITKQRHPHILTVGGGPIFTSLNNNDTGGRKFFFKQNYCDAFVYNQGEKGFVELLREFLACGEDVKSLRHKEIRGCLVNDLRENDKVHVGAPLDAIRNLDDIPSPYLTGIMDEFFDGPYVPLLETNRSCPYRCTFCAWGIGTSKLTQFSENRLNEEIEYFSKRCKNTGSLYVTDANFGILERDAKIAQKLYQCHKQHKYPNQIVVQWNKNRPDRVIRVAREMKGLGDVGASMQSLNEATLEVIKRKNLPLETIAEFSKELKGNDTNLFSELILGLPEETKESHINANKKLVDLGAEIHNYNLHLLPGTEMNTEECRKKYFKETAYRLHDNAYGIYDGKKVFEGQEVVIETSTMNKEELRSFRFIHFLFQFMWGRKWYYDFLRLNQKGLGIHPVDYILQIVEACKEDTGEIGEIYKKFGKDHNLEKFATPEELYNYWSGEESFKRLQSGNYGKLNGLYTQVILLDYRTAFDDFLYQLSKKLSANIPESEKNDFLHECREVLRFGRSLWIDLRDESSLQEMKEEFFDFDIVSWKKGEHKNRLQKYTAARKIKYQYFLSTKQIDFFERQLKQFKSHNINMSLRKMSEDTTPQQFLYQVKPA